MLERRLAAAEMAAPIKSPLGLEIQVSAAGYDSQGVADHASNLATKIRNNLTNSMKALGVDILTGFGSVLGPQKVKYGKDNIITAKDIIIATGSVPFVPKGIEVDGKTVITSDPCIETGEAVISVFSSVNVYTALGSEFTFCFSQYYRAEPNLSICQHQVPLIDILSTFDAKTKEPKDTLEVDAALIATGRAPFTNGLGLENINVATQIGFIPVDERMRVIDENGKLGFKVSIAKTSFKANTKALAENEGEGLAKMIYRPDNGEILRVHIFGLNAADLIHEASQRHRFRNSHSVWCPMKSGPTMLIKGIQRYICQREEKDRPSVSYPRTVQRFRKYGIFQKLPKVYLLNL
ncbi:hypothetical protein BRARA_C04483 [Brassica rapa]|uniref:Uncharacterized protein n=1 Tax=Brassica campestris TaxID=3711 RepID=A0A398ABF9_BRACM|nr:hypothetical protein BRARA_C04483 [Brassica rapa]